MMSVSWSVVKKNVVFFVTFSLLNCFVGLLYWLSRMYSIGLFEVPEIFCNFVVEKCIKSNVW